MTWYKPGVERLPRNWKKLRLQVLYRDDYCRQIRGPLCVGQAREVDHIVDKHDHSLQNLQAVCIPCHRHKTKQQARKGLGEFYQRGKRPEIPHPGLVSG